MSPEDERFETARRKKKRRTRQNENREVSAQH